MRKILLFAAVLVVSTAFVAALASAGTSRSGAAKRPAAVSQSLAASLSKARLATAKYVTNLAAAKADGYGIITKMIPDMGFHYMNPKVAGFNVAKPPILVYLKHGATYQLGALEWVFPTKPKTAPLKGATYGSFPAACHYDDGTFVTASSQADCAPKSAGGSPFFFWHPDLVTMHVWLWYHNPDGLFASMNPLIAPFDHS